MDHSHHQWPTIRLRVGTAAVGRQEGKEGKEGGGEGSASTRLISRVRPGSSAPEGAWGLGLRGKGGQSFFRKEILAGVSGRVAGMKDVPRNRLDMSLVSQQLRDSPVWFQKHASPLARLKRNQSNRKEGPGSQTNDKRATS